MDVVSVTDFKKYALAIIARVAETQQEVTITKRGKPVARVVPHRPATRSTTPGRLADCLVFEGDIVSPIGESEWEASR